MVQYKLYYFDGRGIAEAIRLLFIYTKQPFEDIRFSHLDWAKWTEQEKSKFFYGKVPVLEIDGKQLSQSAAILRYLGEKCGLCGKDEWEKAKMNEIIDFQKDVQNAIMPYIFVKRGYKEGDLSKTPIIAELWTCPYLQNCGDDLAPKKLTEEFRTNADNFFSLYVKLLKESGSGFLLPSGLSIADFVVIEYLDTLRKSEPEAVNKFPELIEFINRVNSLPELKEYVEKRTDPGW